MKGTHTSDASHLTPCSSISLEVTSKSKYLEDPGVDVHEDTGALVTSDTTVVSESGIETAPMCPHEWHSGTAVCLQ